MIEVFKTDIKDQNQANILVQEIHNTISDCSANFDLDDCDKILRVTGIDGEADILKIIGIVKNRGYAIEVLPDDDSPSIAIIFQDEVLVEH